MKFILGVIVFLLLQAGCFCHTVKTVNGKQHVFTNIFHTPHLFQSPCCLSKCFLLIYAPLYPYVFWCFTGFCITHVFLVVVSYLLYMSSYFTCITWLRAPCALRDLCFYILLWLFITLSLRSLDTFSPFLV